MGKYTQYLVIIYNTTKSAKILKHYAAHLKLTITNKNNNNQQKLILYFNNKFSKVMNLLFPVS